MWAITRRSDGLQVRLLGQTSKRMSRERRFPYPYGSDLHWFWGWGARIEDLLENERDVSAYDWMIFRPDRLARDAMMRFSIRYPHIIKQVDDFLDWTEKHFQAFQSNDTEESRANFAEAMDSLRWRIKVGADAIGTDMGHPSILKQAPIENDAKPEGGMVQVFISYSHADERFQIELDAHLANVKRIARVSIWSDKRIPPSSDWEEELLDNLRSAHVFVPLLSSDFFASSYCNKELEIAKDRHSSGELQVVPVLVRECDWKDTWLQKIQALPKNAKPIRSTRNRDRAWTEVVSGIKDVCSRIHRSLSVPGPATE